MHLLFVNKKKNAPRNGEHYLSLVRHRTETTYHPMGRYHCLARLSITTQRRYGALSCKTLPKQNNPRIDHTPPTRHDSKRHGAQPSLNAIEHHRTLPELGLTELYPARTILRNTLRCSTETRLNQSSCNSN